MSTTIRPELSKKNQYWINKQRYYELKHYCMQYNIWKKSLLYLDGLSRYSQNEPTSKTNKVSDPTVECAEERQYYLRHIKLVERVAELTDPVLGEYVLKGVTEGTRYDILRLRCNVPCSRDEYYRLYRKFFFILDKERDNFD